MDKSERAALRALAEAAAQDAGKVVAIIDALDAAEAERDALRVEREILLDRTHRDAAQIGRLIMQRDEALRAAPDAGGV